MSGTTEGYALSIAELGQTVPVTTSDAEAAKRLWSVSEEMVGQGFPL